MILASLKQLENSLRMTKPLHLWTQSKEHQHIIKKFKSEDLTIIKQLSVPTLFLTFSCADLRWDELMEIIQKLSKADKVDVDKSNLSYYARCSVIILILVGGRAGGGKRGKNGQKSKIGTVL